MAGRRNRCPDEPHELHALTADVDDETPAAAGDSPAEEPDRVWEGLKAATRASVAYFKNAPADRLPLLGGAAVYGAGLLAHQFDVPWWTLAIPTAASGVTAFAFSLNRISLPSTIGVTLAAITCGSWLATVAEMGAGRWTNWIYIGAFSLGYGIYRWARHRAKKRNGETTPEAQPEVVDQEVPRILWERYFAGWGMEGAAVIAAEPTRLGERVLVNTKGTGKRASSFVGQAMAERIAEDFDIATVRVRVTNAGLPAGQLFMSVQLIDPWVKAIPHPLCDPDSEYTLPEVADVRKPLPIGADPETGEFLTIIIWDKDGAKQTYVVAVTGGGKSVLLNNLIERLTAADNVVVWGINVSKAQEMRRWAPALDLSACGPEERKKARLMLKMGRKLYKWRGAQPRDTANVVPSTRRKLLAIIVDELDELTKTPDGVMDMGVIEDLGKIASKGRSEAVALILAGQRNTQSHAGSTDVVSQMTNFAVLKGVSVNDLARLNQGLPDIGAYGGGHAGVVATKLKDAVDAKTGRTFALAAGDDAETGLGQIDRIVATRLPNTLEGGAIAHLGEMYTSLKAGQAPTAAATETLERETDESPDGLPVDPTPRVTSSDERTQTIDELRDRHLFLVPPLTPEGQERLREMRAAAREQSQGGQEENDESAASPLNPETRAKLIALASVPDGVSRKEVAEALGVSPTTAWRYMTRLGDVVETRGQGPATRWIARGEHIA